MGEVGSVALRCECGTPGTAKPWGAQGWNVQWPNVTKRQGWKDLPKLCPECQAKRREAALRETRRGR